MASPASLKAEKAGRDPDVANTESSDQSAAGPSATTHSTEDIKNALYEHCAAQPQGTIFSAEDLLRTSLIPNKSVSILQSITSSLTRSDHLSLMQNPETGIACWRCSSTPNNAKLASLDGDAHVVYKYIESAGREGLWVNMLNNKTNLHKAVMDKAIKVLLKEDLIKRVINHRHPSRRTYMLKRFQPLEDVTGGLFFDKGELDEALVQTMCIYIERWVMRRSWWFPKDAEEKVQGKKRKHTAEAPETRKDAEALRAKALDQQLRPIDPNIQRQIRPFPAGYSKYPSISEITNALNDSGVPTTKLKIADMQHLVDILVWDGKFEKLKKRDSQGGAKTVYRSVRDPLIKEDADGNPYPTKATSLTEAPCGKCPVFEFCEEGGLVSARTCPYFQDWLTF